MSTLSHAATGSRAWRYANPVAVRFGYGVLDELGALCGARPVVLVCYPEAHQTGLVTRIERLLGDRLQGGVSDIESNPDAEGLERLYGDFWRTHGQCGLIVAAGGGSTIDTAKVLMVGTASGRFDELLQSLATGASFTPAHHKPLIAVPTTAGTGSEVTGWATVWERARGLKHSLALKQTWPETALVDPELTLSLPAQPTLSAGLDALSHALESIWNIHHNPVSDALAIEAARKVLAHLPQLMEALQDRGLRYELALAALSAGLAFSNTKTALAHSISYPMTLQHGLAHGIACSFTLPMVLERAIGANAGRDAVLGRIFDCPLEQAPGQLVDFLERLGVSTRFEDYGVSHEQARILIAQALDGVRGQNFIGRHT